MANEFRPYEPDQPHLLPVSPREWLPEGHLAYFIADVLAELDLGAVLKDYPGGRGPKGYHPRMLLAVLFYGYCTGVYSSRKLAKHCETDIAFRVLSAGQLPDFRTLADFRRRHLAAFRRLFLEVLRLCREAGLVKLGHLSVDGSKYQANASQHKAVSYGRIPQAEAQLQAEIEALLRQAEAQDQAEDAEHGPDQRGDELPEELRLRERRLARLREAKARLEERAQERARHRAEAREATPEQTEEAVRKAVPQAKEQTNFTDPDSRIMKGQHGWVQGYNAQIVVEEASGVIVAEEVSAHSADSTRLRAMLDAVDANLTAVQVAEAAWRSGVFSADAGYCSEANLALLAERRWDAYVATGRERHYRQGVDPAGTPRTPLRAAMRAKLQTEPGRAVYARRKAITEPVHGNTKQARGFRQFLLRGLGKVGPEHTLVCLTHNLLQLWRAKPVPSAA